MSPEIYFADTNIFLRYLTDDVPEQADAVEAMLERAASGQIVLVTSHMVIAEIVWTLESYYQLSKAAIQEKVFAMLNTPGLEVEDADLVLQAMLWYVELNTDYIDAYNVAWMAENDLQAAYTFDRAHFSRFEGIDVVVPGGGV